LTLAPERSRVQAQKGTAGQEQISRAKEETPLYAESLRYNARALGRHAYASVLQSRRARLVNG
jgi:hypothetical protein